MKTSQFAWSSGHLSTVVSLSESHFVLMWRRSDVQCMLSVYLHSISGVNK